jgi:hypothetical protein
MSVQSIMGGSGIDRDMVSGRPVEEGLEQERRVARDRVQQAVMESAELAIDLKANPQILRVLSAQYLNRLAVLASKDEVCHALEQVFESFNFKVEVAPALRKQQLRKVMGPLHQFIEEPETAP